MRTTAAVVRLHTPKPVLLDDGPETLAFVEREIRLSDLTFREIADRANVCVATVSAIAYGERKLCRWITLAKIARVLGWSITAHKDH